MTRRPRSPHGDGDDRSCPEPITPAPARSVRTPVMRQVWRDAVFLHWETDPEAARRWLPEGTRLDVMEGRTYVGLVGLRMDVVRVGLLPVPHVGSFGEVNVRLYSVDAAGRRGIVFCSLDAGRLAPVLAARAGYRLPYAWSDVDVSRRGSSVSYAVRRRWPRADHPTTTFSVLVGDRIVEPTDLDHFLTARWTLHWRWFGRTMWCATDHPPWRLHSAELRSFDDQLVTVAGLPPVQGRPVSALWSPGVPSLIGPPVPLV